MNFPTLAVLVPLPDLLIKIFAAIGFTVTLGLVTLAIAFWYIMRVGRQRDIRPGAPPVDSAATGKSTPQT